MADSTQTPKDPKKELQAFVERNAEHRQELKERQAEHLAESRQELAESEGRQKENIKMEEGAEIQRKKDEKEWRKKQAEQKKAIEADKKRKKEFEEHQKQLRDKKETERKQRLQYMKDLSDSNRIKMNAERRKKESEDALLALTQQADREFQITKEQTARKTHFDEQHIQKEGQEKRAKADAQEQQELEEIRSDALKEKSRLDEMEKGRKQMHENEYVRKHAQASVLPSPLRESELRKVENEERIDADRIRHEFEKKKSDVEVTAQKKTMEVKRRAQKARDDAVKEERKQINQKEHQKTDQIRQATQQASQKRHDAKKTAESILHPMDKKIIDLPGGLGKD